MSRTKSGYYQINFGSPFIMNIETEGLPPPTLQWYKNGILLENENKNCLKIDKVNVSHSGTYSCDIQNMAGTFKWLEATVYVKNEIK
jgi:hypothetical protein